MPHMFLILIILFGTLPLFNALPIQVPSKLGNEYWDFIGTDETDSKSFATNWSPNPGLFSCQYSTESFKRYYLGLITQIPSSPYTLKRIYTNLQTHTTVRYTVDLMLVDDTDFNIVINVKIDGTIVFTWEVSPSTSISQANCNFAKCGDDQLSVGCDFIIMGEVNHSTDELTLEIEATHTQSTPGFGIRDVTLLLLSDTSSSQASFIRMVKNDDGQTSLCTSSDCSQFNILPTCNSNCGYCKANGGLDSENCYICRPASYFSVDGSCESCVSGCSCCQGGEATDCLVCGGSMILSTDGSCITACSSSQVEVGEGNAKECRNLCSDNQYMLYDANYQCSDSCEYPFTNKVDADTDILMCYSPSCLSNSEYLYPDGTCSNTCTYPIVGSYNDEDTCSPCAVNEYLYENGTCHSTCQTFFKITSQDLFNFCDYPCLSDEYLYQDGSCQETCPSTLYTTRIEGDSFQFCDHLCSDNTYYYYYPDTKSCKSTCKYPYEIQPEILCIQPDLSSSDAKQAQVASDTSSVAGQVAAIASVIVSLLRVSDPSALGSMALTRMFSYLRYIEIDYPSKLQHMFDISSTNFAPAKYFPSIPSSVEEIASKYSLPGRFGIYELTSCFLVNFWQNLMILAILLFLIVITHLTRSCQFISKISQALEWNFFFSFFLTFCDGIVLFTSFELRNLHLQEAFSVLSFLVCIAVNILAIIIPVASFIVIYRFPRSATRPRTKIQVISNFEKIWSSFQVVFAPYQDSRFLQQAFFFAYLLRIYAYYLIIAYLFAAPLAQAILMNLITIAMVLYLVIFRPFKEKLKNYQFIAQEAVIMITLLCLLILAILDAQGRDSFGFRKILGDVMIYSNMCFTVITPIFICFELIILVKRLIKQYQEKKNSVLQEEDSSIKQHQISDTSFISRLNNPSSVSYDSENILRYNSNNMNFDSQNPETENVAYEPTLTRKPRRIKNQPLKNIAQEIMKEKVFEKQHLQFREKKSHRVPQKIKNSRMKIIGPMNGITVPNDQFHRRNQTIKKSNFQPGDIINLD